MTLINTKGMAFFGPGSEWFWAALQFTALAITFLAIYRQLRIGRSQRAVEQVEGYSRQFDNERMARHRLAILVALRDGTTISLYAGSPIGNYFEDVASLCRRGHLDMKLLWNSLGRETQIWWAILEPTVEMARAMSGGAAYEDWEWLARKFGGMDRKAGGRTAIDAQWVANWLAAGQIERQQDTIRLEQALRAVIIASPDGVNPAQVGATAPPPTPSAGSKRSRRWAGLLGAS